MSARSVDRLVVAALALLAAALRLPDLGRWCLAVDEYYLYRATELLAEHGLPRFPGGGYYVRGLVIQLASLPLLGWLPDRELAIRLVPALCGVATVPLTYRLARGWLAPGASIVAAVLLLLSAWQIEFSRFARMYAPFQCLFVLFLIAVRHGWLDGRRGWRFAAVALAAIGPLVYAGAIFMPLVIGAMVLRLERPLGREGYRTVLAAFVLVLLNAVWRSVGFRNLGVGGERFPAEYVPLDGGGFVLILPELELLRAFVSPGGAALLVAAAAALGIWLARLGGRRTDGTRPVAEPWRPVVLTLVVVLPLLHQFGMLVLALTLLVLVGGRERVRMLEERRGWWLGWGLATLAVWSVVGWVLSDATSLPGRARDVLSGLFEYAPVVEAVVEPFVELVPRWSMLAALTVAVAVALELVRPEPARGRWFLPLVFVVCLASVPVFRTTYFTTRYSYFLLPLVAVLAAGVAARLAGRVPRARVAVLLLPLAAFALTEDFQPRVLRAVADPAVAFRTGELERFARHWYPRADFATPAAAVAASAAPDEPVVIDCPPCALELDRPFEVYVSRRSKRFAAVTRERGTRELWTGRPLLSTPEQLAARVPPAGSGRRLWLVTIDDPSGAFRGDDALEAIAVRFGLELEPLATGVDGRVTAWAITAAGT